MTTPQIAAALGITIQRVRALIKAGRLPARKIGRDWHATPEDVEKIRNRPPGRPRHTEEVLRGLLAPDTTQHSIDGGMNNGS